MNRRAVFPLLLLTVALLAGVQAQRTDRDAWNLELLVSQTPAAAATPVFSVRRIPEFLQAPMAKRQLSETLVKPVAALPDGTCLAVGEHGSDLFSMNANRPLAPASTQKLLTAIAALRVLGPDSTLTTEVMVTETPTDGVLAGDLWLVGGGDPLLMTEAYADRFDDQFAYSNLSDLVASVVATGIEEIQGSVIGDDSRYDQIRYLGTWPDRFKPGWSIQSGPLSALSVDDGFANWDPVNPAASLSVPADDPALLAARLFDDLLESEGVRILGRAGSGTAPGELSTTTLASLSSPPIHLLVEQMLVASDNTTAELLVKELSRSSSERGTTVSGLSVVLEALSSAGHPVDGVVPHDGSGLDPDNRLTCGLLVSVLDDREYGSVLVAGLPIAGDRGTMRKRFVGTAGEGRVRAKTGTLRGVSSLAGVVDTSGGRRLAFALVSNGDLPYEIRALHEDVVLALLSYPAGPGADLLSPRPVQFPVVAETSGG
ncbi:MAG: D-alanyl-D-alanine carboxypeptidase/D-alanyl-D-alanine-endopeptidase [Acidimicrobiales bacterium]|nr:D-alanyl-D-alanine carboxypeptidase/D-alanyl-D-alanine-endopeptidase [Acidimicrobiales bacterium]